MSDSIAFPVCNECIERFGAKVADAPNIDASGMCHLCQENPGDATGTMIQDAEIFKSAVDIYGNVLSLPSFAWPGGYPIAYFDSENSVLCAKCATEEGTYPIVARDIIQEYEECEECDYEGCAVCATRCDECGEPIDPMLRWHDNEGENPQKGETVEVQLHNGTYNRGPSDQFVWHLDTWLVSSGAAIKRWRYAQGGK